MSQTPAGSDGGKQRSDAPDSGRAEANWVDRGIQRVKRHWMYTILAVLVGAVITASVFFNAIVSLQSIWGDVYARAPWVNRSTPTSGDPGTTNNQLLLPSGEQPTYKLYDHARQLGEEDGVKVYCEGHREGVHLQFSGRYGGAVIPDCSPRNTVPSMRFTEAWCIGFADGASDAHLQLEDEPLSLPQKTEIRGRCLGERVWEGGKGEPELVRPP